MKYGSVLFFLTGLMVWMYGCANISAPTGGARDSLPPVLLNVAPQDSILNLKTTGNTITFDFDEYIELDDIQKNLIVSPTLPGSPFVTRKLRTVTVKIRDTLDKNTTYTLDFGKGVKDLNEGNPYPNLRYVFSTGNYIDSLSFSGKVILAEDGKIDTTLMVMLHRNMDDSAVAKEKPRYYTRLNKEGEFRFQNLPPENYKVYALKDESGMGRYNSKDVLFAFSDSTVNPADDNEPITLYAYIEEKEAAGANTRRSGTSRSGKKEPLAAKDSLLKFQTNLDGEMMDILKPLKLTFPRQLATIDSTKIQLADSTLQPVEDYSLTLDTSRTILTLVFPWPPETAYNLIFIENAIIDSAGAATGTDTLRFDTKKTRDYGSLVLRFPNYEPGETPLVVLLLQNNEVKHSIPVTGPNWSQKLFPPGEYELRLLYDKNNNGKWDPGHFFEGRVQPEIVKPYEKKLSVRANWDNEHSIEL